MTETYLIRVVAPHWTASAVCAGDRIVRCSPQLQRFHAIGVPRLKEWARVKGFKVEQTR